MKTVSILLALIISASLTVQVTGQVTGQVRQEIKKPDNKKYGVYYLDDQSVMFNTNGLTFDSGNVPKLIEIFETADKLNEFCRANVDIQVNKLIDTLCGYQFVFGYNPSNKLSAIAIQRENKPCNIYVHNFRGMKFTSYLTVHRTEYYAKLETYKFKVQQTENKLDSIIHK